MGDRDMLLLDDRRKTVFGVITTQVLILAGEWNVPRPLKRNSVL